MIGFLTLTLGVLLVTCIAIARLRTRARPPKFDYPTSLPNRETYHHRS